MRTVTISSTLGAIIGAAVYWVLYATSHAVSSTTTFGWYAYRPRRYVDYLPVPPGAPGDLISWWLLLLLAIGIGIGVGAVAGTAAVLAGFRVNRRA